MKKALVALILGLAMGYQWGYGEGTDGKPSVALRVLDKFGVTKPEERAGSPEQTGRGSQQAVAAAGRSPRGPIPSANPFHLPRTLMDNLDRMYRHLVRVMRSRFPQHLAQPFIGRRSQPDDPSISSPSARAGARHE